jgi:hypothetical protein
MVAFGKLASNYQTAKHLLGKVRHAAIHATRTIGKGLSQVHHNYTVGKQAVRNIASKLDRKFGTHGAVGQLAESGIRAVEKSPYGAAVKNGIDEVAYQNKRAQDLLGAFGQ